MYIEYESNGDRNEQLKLSLNNILIKLNKILLLTYKKLIRGKFDELKIGINFISISLYLTNKNKQSIQKVITYDNLDEIIE